MKLLVFLTLLAAVTPQVKADENCQVCVLVSGFIQSALELGNETKAEIKNEIEQSCLKLPASISSECTSIVDQYFSDIVQFLQVGQLEPKAVCQQLGLCSATKSPQLDETTQQEDPRCPVCKVVMAKIDDFVGGHYTEERILHAINGVCDEFPIALYDTCTGYIHTQGYHIFTLLIYYMEPDQVCIALGLCDAKQQLDETTQLKDQQSMTHVLQRLQYPVKKISGKGYPSECHFCELGIKDVDEYMLRNFTETEISSILNDDCDSLEDPVRTQCHDFLNTYGIELVKLIAEGLDPKDVCTWLGYCEARQVKVTMRNGEICQVCKLVGQHLLTVLQSNATEEEIEQTLEQVSGFLPQSLSQECDSLVEKYGSETFSLLQKLTPDELCKALDLCQGKSLVDDNKCTFGPKFWCASPANAKMCNAVQHCVMHVW